MLRSRLRTVRSVWARVTCPLRHEVRIMRLMIEREDAE